MRLVQSRVRRDIPATQQDLKLDCSGRADEREAKHRTPQNKNHRVDYPTLSDRFMAASPFSRRRAISHNRKSAILIFYLFLHSCVDGFASPPLETKQHPKRWKLIKPVEQVEKELSLAVESLQERKRKNPNAPVLGNTRFPSIRECNAALALLGDKRQFLRALRLFGKLRKASVLSEQVVQPTLVTYSTLMSRFVKANKPLVALRLWKLRPSDQSVDVKACNILMNCHAKLADVDSARDLLNQMKDITNSVPLPNLITYNTFLSACQKAGDLDEALRCFREDAFSPDTRTFTTLIATVARRRTTSAGRYDPTMAFELYKHMVAKNIHANGKTFSALIDCCNRCRRSDLALQGLRMMLRQKRESGVAQLPHEVGAWTAAIHGVASLELARKLFDTMVRSGVAPNTVTCGSLTDRLLKAGKTEAAVDVLRYMKENGVGVSEVMVTSLLTRAQELVKREQRREYSNDRDIVKDGSNAPSSTKAIEIYTELLESLLIDQSHSPPVEKSGRQKGIAPPHDTKQLLVVRAFLLFQEIQSTGIDLDLGCYHTLLRVCSKAKDAAHAETVVRKMLEDSSNVTPTDTTWLLLLRSAGNNVETVERMWKHIALAYYNKREVESQRVWTPSLDSFRLLLSVYAKSNQSGIIVELARAVKDGRDWNGFGTDRISYGEVQRDPKVIQFVQLALRRESESTVSRR